MSHLITHGLKPRTLTEVSSPTLIEYYNHALRHLAGKITGPGATGPMTSVTCVRKEDPRWAG